MAGAISHSGIQGGFKDEALADFLKVLIPKEQIFSLLGIQLIITHRKHQKHSITGLRRALSLAIPGQVLLSSRPWGKGFYTRKIGTE